MDNSTVCIEGITLAKIKFTTLEGDKQEQPGDTFLIVIANNSKCNAALKIKQPLPLQKGFSFCPSDKNDKAWAWFSYLNHVYSFSNFTWKLGYR